VNGKGLFLDIQFLNYHLNHYNQTRRGEKGLASSGPRLKELTDSLICRC